uniref:Uncharacterized protein n=1 Tax=Panagrellus redivivus TaxID=6233 RepID=A0A7E4WCH3_PANRE
MSARRATMQPRPSAPAATERRPLSAQMQQLHRFLIRSSSELLGGDPKREKDLTLLFGCMHKNGVETLRL